MTQLPHSSAARLLRTSLLLALVAASAARTQEIKPQASAEKSPELPAQIELLETHIRFESNGDSRKEVHTRIHINNELGARQFARLSFDYNRAFQQIEFPLVRITHQGGGTADILPSAISDQPNPAVVNAPAYQDVRVKSVRILGLAPGDLLEYRVVTTTTNHPLAPEFWLDHTFDRSGVVLQEIFELDLPASRFEDPASHLDNASPPNVVTSPFNKADLWGLYPNLGHLYISPQTPETSKDKILEGDSPRLIYKWSATSADLAKRGPNPDPQCEDADVVVTSFSSWQQLADRLTRGSTINWSTADYPKVSTIVGRASADPIPARSIYGFISKNITGIDLPLDPSRIHGRDPLKTLAAGYGTASDKVALFSLLMSSFRGTEKILLYSAARYPEQQLPRLSLFQRIVLVITEGKRTFYLQPDLEVAPFGVVGPDLRGKKALDLTRCPSDENHCWTTIPKDLPFPSSQRVTVDAAIAADGTLAAKVKYSMRGDNELVLRLAFHQSPKEKWKEIAGLLALSDGFRGRITNVTASDPYATEKPFTVEYEISQPKFVDWSKKPVRIPALLPQLGLPDPPSKPAGSSATSVTSAATASATSAIELGTPLDVETHLTLHLPPGTSAHPPVGNAVVRDYATFASKYSAATNTLTASRHLNFLERQITADRAPDYNAFVRAVHSDESQEFVLERSEPAAAQPTTQNSKKKN